MFVRGSLSNTLFSFSKSLFIHYLSKHHTLSPRCRLGSNLLGEYWMTWIHVCFVWPAVVCRVYMMLCMDMSCVWMTCVSCLMKEYMFAWEDAFSCHLHRRGSWMFAEMLIHFRFGKFLHYPYVLFVGKSCRIFPSTMCMRIVWF